MLITSWEEEGHGDNCPSGMETYGDSSSSSRLDISEQPVLVGEEEEESGPERRRKKSKKKVNKFIDYEAEISEDGAASEDEDEEDLDAFEASFVDDATQRVNVDQRAMYLRSLNRSRPSPMQRRRRNFVPAADVMSQVPDDDEDSQYLEDSFVVDGDEVEFQSQMDTLDHIDELDDTVRFKAGNKRSNNRKDPLCKYSGEGPQKKRPRFGEMRVSCVYNCEISPPFAGGSRGPPCLLPPRTRRPFQHPRKVSDTKQLRKCQQQHHRSSSRILFQGSKSSRFSSTRRKFARCRSSYRASGTTTPSPCA